MPQCPFLLFSANVDSEPTPPKTEKEKEQERAQRAKEREERQKKLQQQREQQRQQEEQQKLLEKQEQQEQQKQQDQEKQREQQRDDGRRERPRERRDERGRDDREERRDDRRDGRRERDRSDRDYYRGHDGRDRSSRRDYSGSETDDDGWERVKPDLLTGKNLYLLLLDPVCVAPRCSGFWASAMDRPINRWAWVWRKSRLKFVRSTLVSPSSSPLLLPPEPLTGGRLLRAVIARALFVPPYNRHGDLHVFR